MVAWDAEKACEHVGQVKGGYHGGDQETAARLDIPRQQPRTRHQG